MILKILTRQQWQQLQDSGVFSGAPIDLQDGYIHFSTPNQVKETVAKHFTGQSNLVIAAVDESQFGDELKWEVSRNQELFPHLYAILKMEHIAAWYEISLDENGQHILPDQLFIA